MPARICRLDDKSADAHTFVDVGKGCESGLSRSRPVGASPPAHGPLMHGPTLKSTPFLGGTSSLIYNVLDCQQFIFCQITPKNLRTFSSKNTDLRRKLRPAEPWRPGIGRSPSASSVPVWRGSGWHCGASWTRRPPGGGGDRLAVLGSYSRRSDQAAAAMGAL